MHLIDSHAHIYLPEFDNDRANIIQKSTAEGVTKILMPAVDATTHQHMLQTEVMFPNCIAMMGLHPCSVNDTYQQELDQVTHYFTQRKFIAVGEIGLDFYWDKTFTNQQYNAFHKQIEIALQYNVPIVIHSRNATEECIEVVKQYPDLTGVFHCFSGTLEQAQQIIALGFMLGIGGVVTFKNGGLDKVVQHLSLTNLLLETDAPYLAPVPYRGKRNDCSYLPLIVQKVAAVTGQSVEEVANQTTQNAIKLFNLP